MDAFIDGLFEHTVFTQPASGPGVEESGLQRWQKPEPKVLSFRTALQKHTGDIMDVLSTLYGHLLELQQIGLGYRC